MKNSTEVGQPDNTAVRTALWRALHLQVDAKPHIIEDGLGLRLVNPPEGWQDQPVMKYTSRIRASIVARARFIEDLAIEHSKKGINQYIILGAGLDTFALRHPEISSLLSIYEIDQPGTLEWKEHRLKEIGLVKPSNLHFVPVNFETSNWWEQLLKAGFDNTKPALIACTGVSLYLTKSANMSTLKKIAALVPNSTLAMTFYLPIELLDETDKPMQEIGEKGAREAGTPFVSFFTLNQIVEMAREAGFKEAKTISTQDMIPDYFANRTDGLLPASGEIFLVAKT